MRIATILVVAWLLIGALAAWQRDYFSDSRPSCADTGTAVVTVIAGPLNFLGANPKVRHCRAP